MIDRPHHGITMAYGSMVTGQLFSGDDTLSEKFFRATSDRVVGPVTRSLYTYDMHATSHAARDIVQVELPGATIHNNNNNLRS